MRIERGEGVEGRIETVQGSREGGSRWEEVEMVMDSGATDTVIGRGVLTKVKKKKGIACIRRAEYELANGEHMPNLGEKTFSGITCEGTVRETVAQVADVAQNLMSVNTCLRAGNRVVFDEDGSYIENKANGTINWLSKKGDLWTMKLWAKNEQETGDEEAEDSEAEQGKGQKGLTDFQRQGGSL